MSGTVLAVDVGNSRIKLGLFDMAASAKGQLPHCRHAVASALDADIPWDDLRQSVDRGVSVAGIVAGVNPHGVQKVLDTWPRDIWPEPTAMERSLGKVLDVKLAAPDRVGIDRLLSAVAANVVREAKRPAVIIDTGTATTVDYVDAHGAFAGGAILPGFELAARSLNTYTAFLPLISIDELDRETHAPLGLDTRHALRSGLFWGQLGAVKELVRQYEAFDARKPQLFLTGGGASLLSPEMPDARYEPHLCLQGLALVQYSQSSGDSDRAGSP